MCSWQLVLVTVLVGWPSLCSMRQGRRQTTTAAPTNSSLPACAGMVCACAKQTGNRQDWWEEDLVVWTGTHTLPFPRPGSSAPHPTCLTGMPHDPMPACTLSIPKTAVFFPSPFVPPHSPLPVPAFTPYIPPLLQQFHLHTFPTPHTHLPAIPPSCLPFPDLSHHGLQPGSCPVPLPTGIPRHTLPIPACLCLPACPLTYTAKTLPSHYLFLPLS